MSNVKTERNNQLYELHFRKENPISQNKLAPMFGIRRQTVGEIIKRMKKQKRKEAHV